MRVGSHAIAAQFVERGWEVAYVAAPITPLNFLQPSSSQFRARLREHRSGGQRDLQDKLWHYVPFSLLAPNNRPLTRSPWLFRNWTKFSLPRIDTMVRNAGFDDVDVLFLDSIYQPSWLDGVRYKRCVVRLSDYNAGFSGYGAGARESEMLAIARADLVVTASRHLSQWALDNGAQKAMFLPNGVDIERFAAQPERPPEYVPLSGPIAVFVGDISAWVDLDLVGKSARALPHVNFVLIGPGAKSYRKGSIPENIHFLGIKSYRELPAYLRHADVGLIPFHLEKHDNLVAHIHPLKLYEYLAAGLPVVSTRWSEIESLASPAVLCSSIPEFVNAIAVSLDSSDHSRHYQKYAESAAWPLRLAPLFSWLDRDV
jgi:glycosyltransferase involved in cell wall biosynthesis